jgi:hypothetical protein
MSSPALAEKLMSFGNFYRSSMQGPAGEQQKFGAEISHHKKGTVISQWAKIRIENPAFLLCISVPFLKLKLL